MGGAGTDVAREASSLALPEENVATIVGAVREDWRIFDTISANSSVTMSGRSGSGTRWICPHEFCHAGYQLNR